MLNLLKMALVVFIAALASRAIDARADAPATSDPVTAAHLAFLRQHFDFKWIPQEGGYYFSTYRSDETLPAPPPGTGTRLAGTAIYFLMTPGDFSALHRLKSDEVYHFYGGSPIELVRLFPDGTGSVTICGPEFWNGQQPQIVIKRGTWQGSHPIEAGTYSLLGTTMSPGFDPADFELGQRADLLKAYPAFAEKIKALTR